MDEEPIYYVARNTGDVTTSRITFIVLCAFAALGILTFFLILAGA